MQDEAKYAA